MLLAGTGHSSPVLGKVPVCFPYWLQHHLCHHQRTLAALGSLTLSLLFWGLMPVNEYPPKREYRTEVGQAHRSYLNLRVTRALFWKELEIQ